LTHYASIILGILGIEKSIRDGILGKNLVKTCVIEYSSYVIRVFYSKPTAIDYRDPNTSATMQTRQNSLDQ